MSRQYSSGKRLHRSRTAARSSPASTLVVAIGFSEGAIVAGIPSMGSRSLVPRLPATGCSGCPECYPVRKAAGLTATTNDLLDILDQWVIPAISLFFFTWTKAIL